MNTKNKISRRRFLRDIGVSAAAVPFIYGLESLYHKAEAQAVPKKRLVVFYTPNGQLYGNWRLPQAGLDLDISDGSLLSGATLNLNPLGFLFEHYDSMGYYVTTDSNGQPVNSAATLVGTGDPMLDVATTDAVQLTQHLAADDSSVAQCMVNQVYRYAMHRIEGSGDQMALAALTDAFNKSGRNVKMLLGGLTQSEAFLNRLNVP